jgi:hypothetical protein
MLRSSMPQMNYELLLICQENRTTDMTGFRLRYNLDKHAPDQDSNLDRTNLVGRCS